MANQYSFFYGKGGSGDGGDADLNIAYGTTAPSDTTKLWIAHNISPSKVLMNNNLDITSIDQFSSYIISDGKVRFDLNPTFSKIASNGNSIYASYLTNSPKMRCLARYDYNSKTYTVINSRIFVSFRGFAKCCLDSSRYIFFFDSDSGHFYPYVLDTQTDTYRFLGGDWSYNYAYNQTPFSIGNKMFFENYSIDSSGTIGTIPNIGKEWQEIYPAPDGSRYAYYVQSETNNVYDLRRFDAQTTSIALIKSSFISGKTVINMLYKDNQLYVFTRNTSNVNMVSIDIYNLNGNFVKNLVSNINISEEDVRNQDYIFGPDNTILNCYNGVTGELVNKSLIRMQLAPHLQNNNLSVIFNSNNSRWNAINSSNLELNVNPISVYLGNSSGIGEKKEARLWNGSQWVAI